MLRIDTNKATFPLLLSFNFAVSTPLSIKGNLNCIYAIHILGNEHNLPLIIVLHLSNIRNLDDDLEDDVTEDDSNPSSNMTQDNSNSFLTNSGGIGNRGDNAQINLA